MLGLSARYSMCLTAWRDIAQLSFSFLVEPILPLFFFLRCFAQVALESFLVPFEAFYSRELAMAHLQEHPALADGQDDAASSLAAWAEPESVPGQEEVNATRAEIMKAMSEIGKTFGNPRTYLLKKMPAGADREKFSQWLWDAFPESDDVLYHHESKLPEAQEGDLSTEVPMCVHVASLGFDKVGSMKPPPGKDVFGQLVENILLDGFVTGGDALLVCQPEELSDGSRPPWGGNDVHCAFSLGYVKGQARATSLLAILYYCFEKQIDLQTVHKKLFESVTKVWVFRVAYTTRADEALANMRLSARGSIRRANNLIITVVMLQNLGKQGAGDTSSFVRRWVGIDSRPPSKF